MDLSDRKRKILQAVIDEYIGTAEPVGSRAISKRDNLNLSSATIRNEMADLEDMGYLIQPHTSAGRIPSDEGYRFYVNSLMERYQVGMEAIIELQKAFQMRITRLDQIIKYAGSIASSLTDYATIITAPQRGESMLRKVDLVPISNEKTTVVVVTETVRSHVINMALSDDECNILATALNKYLKGLTSKDVTIDKMREVSDRIKERTKLDEEVLARVLKFVFETITDDDTEIYVSNMQSILKYPEYRDVNKAGKMFSFLENKDNLRRLIMSDNGEGIHAKIGSENEDEILKDCSLVTVDYSLGDNRGGKISVIGPKRMNYSKVFASLDTISGEIDKILRYYTNNG
ncbi:MAG: heat-inducible transcription repressor HrcA [Clostridia bacterium]|nr:heat-inducible transcription repressor HrcA [Clostridia bacterium]